MRYPARMGVGAVGLAVFMTLANCPAALAPNLEPQQVNRFGRSSALPKTKDAVRIATYNVLNLFDLKDDPSLRGEFDDIRFSTSEERCRGLAAAIREVDADILALEEVESLDALLWFRDTFLPKSGYEYSASFDVGYFRGVECSVLSRFPITDAKVWPNDSLDRVQRNGPGWEPAPREHQRGLTFQRSPLRADIRVNEEYELTLFVLHHKSGGDFRFQREAEALRTIELINEVRAEDASRNIIVLGDFNAAPWDKSVRVYLEAGLIDTLAHRIIPRWQDPMPTTLEEERLSKTHESDRVIDYILLNSAAYCEFIVGSAFVLGTLYDPDYDWQTDQSPPGYASDHYPVAIDLVPRDVK